MCWIGAVAEEYQRSDGNKKTPSKQRESCATDGSGSSSHAELPPLFDSNGFKMSRISPYVCWEHFWIQLLSPLSIHEHIGLILARSQCYDYSLQTKTGF